MISKVFLKPRLLSSTSLIPPPPSASSVWMAWREVSRTHNGRRLCPSEVQPKLRRQGLCGSSVSGVYVIRRALHTSVAAEGRKARNIPSKNFYNPTNYFWASRANMWKNGIITEDANIAKIAHSLAFLSHPQGDLYWKEREIKDDEEDARVELRYKYFSLYPEERLLCADSIHQAEKQWFELPVERFLNKYQRLKSQYGGIDDPFLWKQCIQEKEWENEAHEIERNVCALQAQEMFGILSSVEDESPTQFQQGDIDPRIPEHQLRLERDKIDEMVQNRINNPGLPPITPEELDVPTKVVIKYISQNENSREYFSESVYWEYLEDELGYQPPPEKSQKKENDTDYLMDEEKNIINDPSANEFSSFTPINPLSDAPRIPQTDNGLMKEVETNLRNWATCLLTVSSPDPTQDKNSKIEQILDSLIDQQQTQLASPDILQTSVDPQEDGYTLFSEIKAFQRDYGLNPPIVIRTTSSTSTFTTTPPPPPQHTSTTPNENKSYFVQKGLEQELQELFRDIKSL